MSNTMRGTCAATLIPVRVHRQAVIIGGCRVVRLRVCNPQAVGEYVAETSYAPLASQADVSDMTQEEVEAKIAEAVYQE